MKYDKEGLHIKWDDLGSCAAWAGLSRVFQDSVFVPSSKNDRKEADQCDVRKCD